MDFVPQPQEKKRKMWPILAIGGGVLIVALVIMSIVIPKLNTGIDESVPQLEPTYYKNDRYSNMLNLYVIMGDDTTEDRLLEMMKASGVDESYLQLVKIEVEDETETGDNPLSYIAPIAINPGEDYSGQNIEYISFNYVPADEDDEEPSIENITYHSYHDGKYDYIMHTSDYEFTHSNGEYAYSFDSITDAADDYLARL